MTRRERREAERRRAESEFDAQQAAQSGAAEGADAAEASPAAAPTPAATSAPPVLPVPPRPATVPGAPAAAEAAAAPLPEVPQFTSRSQRKRFLREHDLPPDIATASIPIVLAERAAGSDGDADTDADPAAAAAETDSRAAGTGATDGATAADDSAAAEDSAPVDAPEADDTGATQSLFRQSGVAEPVAEPDTTATASPGSLFGAAPAQSAPADTAALADTAGTAPRTPAFDLASRRVDSQPSGPDFETSSTAVITPSALGDHDAPLRRRSPVIKPPTGSNIRVVTGALPIVTEADLDANPPTTPMAAIDQEAFGADDRGTVTFRTSESPVFSSATPASDPWTRALADDEEEDSDELEEPPARPMSARSVTNEDGTVLVAERNSMVPYIVLGATGFVALVLVIVALTLLF